MLSFLFNLIPNMLLCYSINVTNKKKLNCGQNLSLKQRLGFYGTIEGSISKWSKLYISHFSQNGDSLGIP